MLCFNDLPTGRAAGGHVHGDIALYLYHFTARLAQTMEIIKAAHIALASGRYAVAQPMFFSNHFAI